MNHLLSIQETNSQGNYRTHTHVISKVCLGSKTQLTKVQQTLGFLNTKVMGHFRKRGLPSSYILISALLLDILFLDLVCIVGEYGGYHKLYGNTKKKKWKGTSRRSSIMTLQCRDV